MIILLFVLKILFFAIIISLGATLAIYIFLTIFVFPYLMWVGHQHTIGKYKEFKGESVGKAFKHSLCLYKSWITRKPPVF